MKKHRFHFSRESSERMKDFSQPEETAESQTPTDPTGASATETPPAQDAPAAPCDTAAETPETAEAEAEKAREAQPADDPEVPFLTASRTDVGKVRANNQDAVILAGRLAGVADGMGGHLGGETASAIVRDGLIALLRDKEPDASALRTGVEAVNRRVFLKSEEDEHLRGMGTTLTVLWLGDVEALIAHVGDSRCYRLRDGELQQMTEDHSLVMEMVRAGALTREQAHVHPMRNVITRAVGTDQGVDIDMLHFPREKGDLWLICSDGLHGMVSDDEMQAILTDESASLENKAQRLLEAALDAGGRDNVSLVLLLDQEGGHA